MNYSSLPNRWSVKVRRKNDKEKFNYHHAKTRDEAKKIASKYGKDFVRMEKIKFRLLDF